MEGTIAFPAALIGDPVRAAILMALSDGRAQPATALAYAARVSSQSASNHLAKLLEGGLLAVERQGRHRYYRLATPQVAVVLEALSCLTPPPPHRAIPMPTQARVLAFGRSCYDHLAGKLGVAVASQLERRGYLTASESDPKLYSLTNEGSEWFASLPLDPNTLRPGRNDVARRCLDWTERRHHVAGPIGAALLARFLAEGWLRRERKSRALDVTPAGARWFSKALEIDVNALEKLPGDRAYRVPPVAPHREGGCLSGLNVR